MLKSMNTGMQDALGALEENVQKIGDAGHEIALTTVGLVVVGVEESQRVWQRRRDVLQKAQTRGAEVEADFIESLQIGERRITQRLRALSALRPAFPQPSEVFTLLARRLRNQIDEHLVRRGVDPARDNWQEIEITVTDNPSHFEEREGTGSFGSTAVSDPVSRPLPIPEYEHMNAKTVVAQLDTLHADQLQLVEAYERGHANRVTVLRAIARRRAILEEETG